MIFINIAISAITSIFILGVFIAIIWIKIKNQIKSQLSNIDEISKNVKKSIEGFKDDVNDKTGNFKDLPKNINDLLKQIKK